MFGRAGKSANYGAIDVTSIGPAAQVIARPQRGNRTDRSASPHTDRRAPLDQTLATDQIAALHVESGLGLAAMAWSSSYGPTKSGTPFTKKTPRVSCGPETSNNYRRHLHGTAESPGNTRQPDGEADYRV